MDFYSERDHLSGEERREKNVETQRVKLYRRERCVCLSMCSHKAREFSFSCRGWEKRERMDVSSIDRLRLLSFSVVVGKVEFFPLLSSFRCLPSNKDSGRDHLSILFLLLSLISFILFPCFHLLSVEKRWRGMYDSLFSVSLPIVMLSYSSPFSCAISLLSLYPQEKEKEYTFQSRWGWFNVCVCIWYPSSLSTHFLQCSCVQFTMSMQSPSFVIPISISLRIVITTILLDA